MQKRTQPEKAYLIGGIAYADIEVLVTIQGQWIVSEPGIATMFSEKGFVSKVYFKMQKILTGKSVFTTSPSKTSNRFCSGFPFSKLLHDMDYLIQTQQTLHSFREFCCHPRIQFNSNDLLCFLQYLDCQITRSWAYFEDNLLAFSFDSIAQFGRNWRLTSLCLRSALSTY